MKQKAEKKKLPIKIYSLLFLSFAKVEDQQLGPPTFKE